MKRVRPISIAIAYDGGIGRPVAHILMVDSAHDVHERTSDQPPGQWSTWPATFLPAKRKQRSRARTRKK
jgi:hypothetical protein